MHAHSETLQMYKVSLRAVRKRNLLVFFDRRDLPAMNVLTTQTLTNVRQAVTVGG